jgi:hypothetical protein
MAAMHATETRLATRAYSIPVAADFGEALANVYFEEELGQRAAAKLLTKRRGKVNCRE